ncbi:MAG: polyphenol oxidase family protein [Deltaproteobacteria bacterium]|jgi:copper oxidase (laccase) domain-containing protein|nr:polyphenol oxidase family protein [Deltaproteobacteria bacterium]
MLESRPEPADFFPKIIPFAFPGIPGVSCFFSTALYGDISLDAGRPGGEAAGRRAGLSRLLGFASWTELRQAHGDLLLKDPEPTPFDAPSDKEADGTCSSRPGQALLVKAADCQQILLAHKSGRYVAALHCGWKGNALDFPGKGLAAFCRAYALSPAEVLAVRGPSLGPGAAEFVNFELEWPERFRPWFNPATRNMDLWSLTRSQLLAAGLLPEHFFTLDLCTYTFSGEEAGFLFSYRRGHAGRQAALIFIN